MTTETKIPPSHLEILRAKKTIFHGDAWKTFHGDTWKTVRDYELSEQAGQIVIWHQYIACTELPDLSASDAHADEAVRLLALLPEPKDCYPDLACTRKTLWDLVLRGFIKTKDLEREKVYAQALLDTPRFDSRDQLTKLFEAMIREGLAQVRDMPRLYRLLKIGTSTSNPLVIRKAWQTIGAAAPIEDLLLASTSFLKFKFLETTGRQVQP